MSVSPQGVAPRRRFGREHGRIYWLPPHLLSVSRESQVIGILCFAHSPHCNDGGAVAKMVDRKSVWGGVTPFSIAMHRKLNLTLISSVFATGVQS